MAPSVQIPLSPGPGGRRPDPEPADFAAARAATVQGREGKPWEKPWEKLHGNDMS